MAEKTKCEEVCVEGKENRGKGEIKKTKGEENVAEKKTEEKKKKSAVLVIRVVRSKGMNNLFFYFF